MQKKATLNLEYNRYFLDIAYNGAIYHGWQVQNNVLTIQGIIKESLYKVLNKDLEIVGSSRTDTGVHAKQQIAHVDLPDSVDVTQLQYKLNCILPKDIAIKKIYPVKNNSHARFSAIDRTYHYNIVYCKSPFYHDFFYNYRNSITWDIDNMNNSASILHGNIDFRNFSKNKLDLVSSFCNVLYAKWHTTTNGFMFVITANRFLRGMVRIIVGLMIKIGDQKLDKFKFECMLNSEYKIGISKVAPPCGLVLERISYDTNIFVNE